MIYNPINIRRNAKSCQHRTAKDQRADIANINAFLPLFNRKISLVHGHINARVVLKKTIAFVKIEYMESLLCFCHKVHKVL